MVSHTAALQGQGDAEGGEPEDGREPRRTWGEDPPRQLWTGDSVLLFRVCNDGPDSPFFDV